VTSSAARGRRMPKKSMGTNQPIAQLTISSDRRKNF
jgi:hypothetical protein